MWPVVGIPPMWTGRLDRYCAFLDRVTTLREEVTPEVRPKGAYVGRPWVSANLRPNTRRPSEVGRRPRQREENSLDACILSSCGQRHHRGRTVPGVCPAVSPVLTGALEIRAASTTRGTPIGCVVRVLSTWTSAWIPPARLLPASDSGAESPCMPSTLAAPAIRGGGLASHARAAHPAGPTPPAPRRAATTQVQPLGTGEDSQGVVCGSRVPCP